QSAQIGVADADFYPHISILGTISYSAQRPSRLFRSSSLEGLISPTFRWELLNYGRIRNNVRLQEARFQELVTAYQNTALLANQEVENGLVTSLRSQQRARFQAESVDFAEKAVKVALTQYKAGTVDFTRVTQLEQNLVLLQGTLAQARGQI